MEHAHDQSDSSSTSLPVAFRLPPMRRIVVTFLGVMTVVAALSESLAAQDGKVKETYETVWQQVSELLHRREYNSAVALLDTAAAKPELRTVSIQIESDKAALVGLQLLELLVQKQAAKLEAGSALELNGISYNVVRYESDRPEGSLVLKSPATDRQITKAVTDLPASTWIHLVKLQRTVVSNDPLTLAIFLGFDRNADMKEARKLFNEAAKDGADVTRWLTRLDALEASQKREADKKQKRDVDPVVGHWSATTPDGLSRMVEFRADGSAILTIPVQTLLEMRKRKVPLPVNNPDKGKWVKDPDGSYRVTGSTGLTISFQLVEDHLMTDPNPDGKRTIATRQVKP